MPWKEEVISYMIPVLLNTSIECGNGLKHGEISLYIVHVRVHIEFSRLDDHTKWMRDGQHKHFLAAVYCSDWCFSCAHSNATPGSNVLKPPLANMIASSKPGRQ